MRIVRQVHRLSGPLIRSGLATATRREFHCREFHCREFHCREFHCREFHCREFHCRE